MACGVAGLPYGLGNGAVGVGPHVEERCPAEELNHAHLEEHLPCAFWLFLRSLAIGGFLGLNLILRKFFGWHFANIHHSVNHTENEDCGTNIERPNHRWWHLALWRNVGNTDGGKQQREHIAHDRASVAQKRLNAIRLSFLLFVHEVAHHHLEGLHRHVDAGVEEHEGYQAKHHRSAHCQAKRAGVGEQTHHEHCHKRAHKQVRNAAAEAAPCFITEIAHERLNEHTHEWWKNPEETQIVWVGSEGGEDAADVGTLKCIRNLHPEKSETDVKQFRKTQIRFCFKHISLWF